MGKEDIKKNLFKITCTECGYTGYMSDYETNWGDLQAEIRCPMCREKEYL